MSATGFLILDNGQHFRGNFLGGSNRAGEVVFNTSHNGYEEIATDPSYFGQIIVMCAPQQGNYGVDKAFWESEQVWIRGFIALEVQDFDDERSWVDRLTNDCKVPVLTGVDTRSLTLTLRNEGTLRGALVTAESLEEATKLAAILIAEHKKEDKDWAYAVSSSGGECFPGAKSSGPRLAVMDFGCKKNILRELAKRSREVKVFSCRVNAADILDWNPDGILLSNGPGDPSNVEKSVDTIKTLIGKKPIFGICMGHQLLGKALGANTYRLKFGHRGANHPVQDLMTGKITMTSQNHGYALENKELPDSVEVTHLNLNDNTVSGIQSKQNNCFSVQFHPENHPGPRDAENLFDRFIGWVEDGIQ